MDKKELTFIARTHLVFSIAYFILFLVFFKILDNFNIDHLIIVASFFYIIWSLFLALLLISYAEIGLLFKNKIEKIKKLKTEIKLAPVFFLLLVPVLIAGWLFVIYSLQYRFFGPIVFLIYIFFTFIIVYFYSKYNIK